MIAAIAVCVLLFACGGDRRSAESGDIPAKPKVSEAAVAVTPPPVQPAAPVEPVPSTPPQPPASAVQPAPAEEVVPEPEIPARPPETGGTHIFSNKDLRRYTRVKEEFGLGGDEITVDLTAAAPQTEAPAAPAMTDAQREQEMRDVMKQINELSAEAAYLKSRIPSLHNPFLARVKPSEADAAAEAGMDNAQRLERVNERLSQVNTQLDHLRRRLTVLNQAEPKPDTP